MSFFDKDIIPVQTAEQMVATYDAACADIREGYRLLYQAQHNLNLAFGPYTRYGNFEVMPYHSGVDDIIKGIGKSVWSRLIDRVGAKRIMSVKGADKLDRDIKEGKIPPVTVEEIFNLLMALQQNADSIVEELVKEVFEWLVPHKYGNMDVYKTPDYAKIGKKTVVRWCVHEYYYNGQFFDVDYDDEQRFTALDHVFHLLDGKGVPEGYISESVDAINKSGRDGRSETDYFRFRAFKNRNVWIEFKRMDLVTRFNAIAGGLTFDRPS
jgi:hypothetical protein